MSGQTRKPVRLRGYDYSSGGTYFVTICSQDRKRIFWSEQPVGQGLSPCLSPAGLIVQEEIEALPERFPSILIDNYVVMDNHVHILLTITRQGQSPCPTLGAVIGACKSITTKRINKMWNTLGRRLWQWRFHDHIIRDEADYLSRWTYIETNPARRREDKYCEE